MACSRAKGEDTPPGLASLLTDFCGLGVGILTQVPEVKEGVKQKSEGLVQVGDLLALQP